MNAKIGIIIPSYNDIRISNAIDSVIKNDTSGLTRIYVIDGESNIETLKLIKNNLRPDDYLISEKDRGVFDALNKGIETVSEEIIGWLGADDYFPQRYHFFEEIYDFLSSDIEVDALVYDCQIVQGNSHIRITKAVGSKEIIQGRHNGHYATFIKKSSVGNSRFNINKIYADILFFFDLAASKDLKFFPVNKVGVFQELGGISNNSIYRIIRNNFTIFNSMRLKLGFFKSFLYVFRKIYYKLPAHQRIHSIKSKFKNFIKSYYYLESFLRWKFLFRLFGQSELEAEMVSKITKKNNLAIDVGAAEGFYSYIFSKHFSHVISFEPHPAQFKRLNSFAPKNVNANKIALSDKDSLLNFFIPKVNGKYIPHEAKVIEDSEVGHKSSLGEIQQVNSIKLDSFLSSEDKGMVDIIKIDVEGYELKALMGMKEILIKSKPVILCEIELRHDPHFMETFNFLINQGYKIFVTRDGKKLDKLIFDESILRKMQSPLRLMLRLHYPSYSKLLPYTNNFIFIHHEDKL